jgi:hypothetical protein
MTLLKQLNEKWQTEFSKVLLFMYAVVLTDQSCIECHATHMKNVLAHVKDFNPVALDAEYYEWV